MKERFAKRIAQADFAETLILLVPFMVAQQHSGLWFSALLVAITITFSVIVPYVLVVRGVGDRALTRSLGHLSPLVGVVILVFVGSPRVMVALAAAMAAILLATFAVKGSPQVAAVATLTVAAFALHWIAGVLAVLLLAIVCWAPVRLGHHTLGRVAISAVAGPAAGLAVFLLAR